MARLYAALIVVGLLITLVWIAVLVWGGMELAGVLLDDG